MIRHVCALLLLAPSLLAAAGSDTAPPASSGRARPNILWIVADDLGWTDLGCYGSRYYRTPSIDGLGGGGMRFTAAYTCGPNCAPTRACLMTGLYTPRHGVYTVGSGARGQEAARRMVPAPNRTTLDPSFVTVAEALRASGYATACFGKWHLGAPGEAGPEEQGFDHNRAGNHTGHPRGGYFSPYRNPQLADGPDGENLTDRLSDEVIAWVRAQRDRRFFVYLPYYAVHTPIQAKPELVAECAKRTPHGGHRSPRYAAMVETMDTGIGRILGVLEELGLSERTLVIFSSDNGGVGGYAAAGVKGARDITSQAPLRGGKGMLYEGGIRVPLIVRWPGVTRPGSECAAPVISVDFFPTLAEVAGAKPPARCDGVSLVPLFEDPSAHPRRDTIYWHFPGYLQAGRGSFRTRPAGAIRRGEWKLIEFFEDGRTELYHLSRDIGESRDLARESSEKRAELHAALRRWRVAVGAPMPTPKTTGDGSERAGDPVAAPPKERLQ